MGGIRNHAVPTKATLSCRIATYRSLGLRNLARVGLYRLALRSGWHPVLRISADVPREPFFTGAKAAPEGASALNSWRGYGLWFSHHVVALDGPPDWHANPLREGFRAEANLPWHQIPDFDPNIGDIKAVWEASRFDWLIAMATRAAAGEDTELARLNHWLAHWSTSNPPYLGANWKCGQEASIRVMHLALTALLLGGEDHPCDGLRNLIRLHLRRIAPTIGYAIGQANNHGTSEAAALFIGGSWLNDAEGKAWAATGRSWLEERSQSLIMPDGTFSQYSTVYHRVMLDTYSLAEVWRRRRQLPEFSAALRGRLSAATGWLAALTDLTTGDVPNLGANDGARLLPLTNTPFRDFRPALQLAAAVFCHARAVAELGPWDQPGLWLGVARASAVLPAPVSCSLDEGGLHILRRGSALAVLRYPRFQFRPSHADALHLDLWLRGKNLLRDSGTFSYADPTGADLSGTAAHNTVAFDGRDQMPRLGRFLFGHWLRAREIEPVQDSGPSVTAAAGYRDHVGAIHHRKIILREDGLTCIDRLAGRFDSATLRWRLAPGDWQLDGDCVTDGTHRLCLKADAPVVLTLVEGRESRHYLELRSLPVLEVEVTGPCSLTTEVLF